MICGEPSTIIAEPEMIIKLVSAILLFLMGMALGNKMENKNDKPKTNDITRS